MKKQILFVIGLFLCVASSAQRIERTLENGWKFHLGEAVNAQRVDFNDEKWQAVTVPHDWAIYGPFDRSNDLQKVAIVQNNESVATYKTGRTGGLPYVGIGWYRIRFNSNPDKQTALMFDGAMSEARIYINGKEVYFWPYGYNSFHFDATPYLNKDGQDNVLAVRLENKPQSSRWYPGAGLYRNVHLIETNKVHIPIWGTHVTTPVVTDSLVVVLVKTKLEGVGGEEVELRTTVIDDNGTVVYTRADTRKVNHELPLEQNLMVENPKLWSPEEPNLYIVNTDVYYKGKKVDTYQTTTGFRTLEYIPNHGFYLNGKNRKIQGVCLHHDLGPLGAAVNTSAIRHQLELLKAMGCDAIRTAHNMPAPELVELCDEMGFMMQLEPFDEWDVAKCKNGYHRYFEEWAEKDMVNMLHHYRNNPSVIMWSIGNEVPTQWTADGYEVAKFLQDICHREDPTRLVTCGMDQVDAVLANGFAAMLDIPGFNYRVHKYDEAFEKLPQNIILGTETSSTVSSRGEYKLPVVKKADAVYADNQSSSYDMEHCSWSNLPDDDLAKAEDNDWHMGQFVWTGFDYLGEPSPYDTDAWPNHSSMFGIIDLASIPKDRYYLYKSVWNKKDETLHVLPHWNWEGYEGKEVPIFVYTSYPEAEVFINGKSYGRMKKNMSSNQARYRLMWNHTKYEPGELRVVAYDNDGNEAEQKIIKTAGKAHHIKMETNYEVIQADGKSLAYVTLSIVDKDGTLCPNDSRELSFKVSGAGTFRAVANGDPTCLELFHIPNMHAFNGMLTVIVQSGSTPGDINIEAKGKGVLSGDISIETK